MKILCSVVSHDQQSLVQVFLDSMDTYMQVGKHSVQVIVTENSLNEINLKSNKFVIRKVINLRRKGFGENHNSAFEKSESDYFFIVNPDIRLLEDTNLEKIIDDVTEKNLDIASPKVVDPRGKTEDYKRADLSFVNLIKRKLFKADHEKFDWFAGMFLVVNSASFRKLKGFDACYFMYVEDCDLSMRARRAGMRLGDIEGFSVVHDARRASSKNFRHLKWHIKSLLRYWFLVRD